MYSCWYWSASVHCLWFMVCKKCICQCLFAVLSYLYFILWSLKLIVSRFMWSVFCHLQVKLVTVEVTESQRRLVTNMRQNWTRCRQSWRSCRQRNESTPNFYATRHTTRLSWELFAMTSPVLSSLKSVPSSVVIHYLDVYRYCDLQSFWLFTVICSHSLIDCFSVRVQWCLMTSFMILRWDIDLITFFSLTTSDGTVDRSLCPSVALLSVLWPLGLWPWHFVQTSVFLLHLCHLSFYLLSNDYKMHFLSTQVRFQMTDVEPKIASWYIMRCKLVLNNVTCQCP